MFGQCDFMLHLQDHHAEDMKELYPSIFIEKSSKMNLILWDTG